MVVAHQVELTGHLIEEVEERCAHFDFPILRTQLLDAVQIPR